MPDDSGPGELDQVRDCVALVADGMVGIAEHPSIVPELVEPAEVAMCDPLPRLGGVAVAGPPPGEPPQMVVQRAEYLAGHHSSVVGGPTSDDRVESDNESPRVGAACSADLLSEPFPDAFDRVLTRLD